MSLASDINERIAARSVVVLTFQDLCNRARNGTTPSHVDIVAFAFTSGISGTAAVLVVPVAGRGVFTRADTITLNGLRGHPGPAPNERLGVVDTMIFAEERTADPTSNYDGAELFLDLLYGRSVQVECHSVEKKTHHNSFVLHDTEFARFYIYNAPLPPSAGKIATLREGVVSGTRIALNGSQGIVIGTGTRSRPGASTLSITADMHDMDPALFMAGNGCAQHVVALALAPRGAMALKELSDWGNAERHESFGCDAAIEGAEGLMRLIEDRRFQLAETGAMHSLETGGGSRGAR